jgi:hypothetical protein
LETSLTPNPIGNIQLSSIHKLDQQKAAPIRIMLLFRSHIAFGVNFLSETECFIGNQRTNNCPGLKAADSSHVTSTLLVIVRNKPFSTKAFDLVQLRIDQQKAAQTCIMFLVLLFNLTYG